MLENEVDKDSKTRLAFPQDQGLRMKPWAPSMGP